MLTEEQKSKLCLKCQYCCKYAHIPLAPVSGSIAIHKGIRGMDIRFHNFHPWLVIYAPCQHLSERGCKIYKNRPSQCKEFDGRLMVFDSNKCLWHNKD